MTLTGPIPTSEAGDGATRWTAGRAPTLFITDLGMLRPRRTTSSSS